MENLAAAAISFLAGGAAVYLWGVRGKPDFVSRLSETADRLSHGDLGARADVAGPEEFARLGTALNSMADRIESMIGELSDDKARLKATLDNMSEAVALLGPEGEIQELNPVMERLFTLDTSRVRGKFFAKAVSHKLLVGLLDRALREGVVLTDDISIDGREDQTFEAVFNPILREGRIEGCVLVLGDVTRRRRLEEMRREFVANVSHELRTPLASIKGYAETLARGGLEDVANRMDFVRTIEAHADRLSALVDDLLELAAIESGKQLLHPEPVVLALLVQDVIKNLKPLAGPKGIKLTSAVGSGLRVSADIAALRRVFQNLLTNGIKYNKEEGNVTVFARADGEKILVTVADTGIGVPEKHLAHLFERFYRVDKARSRGDGGTGLGLSIVKHLVENLGGSIRAESEVGQGSSFHFSLPYASGD